MSSIIFFFFFKAKDGQTDSVGARWVGKVYKRQELYDRMVAILCGCKINQIKEFP